MFVNRHFINSKVRASKNVKGVEMQNCIVIFYMKMNEYIANFFKSLLITL